MFSDKMNHICDISGLAAMGHSVTVLYEPGQSVQSQNFEHWRSHFASFNVSLHPLTTNSDWTRGIGVSIAIPDAFSILRESYKVFWWLRFVHFQIFSHCFLFFFFLPKGADQVWITDATKMSLM
jgi:hypothetical protein